MANFFKDRREELGLSTTQIGARLGTTAQAVRQWEQEVQYPARPTVATVAAAYEVSEERAAREIMEQRRRIESAKSEPHRAAS